ncbi:pentatricopeptide repeat-containing protein At3g04760, chloroplastic-like [Salvia hispanica]|uniref:pentatricopeptide repeat-containing protein At3g04760, chloroplastic-like n=1 Tax=Salvia hispanica TaxID=49212 RepID=UPI0020095263|nr:pentatricopeptide repeat-containing protein At3g04760, chloroplastic-like [Salvia hispanica]
MRTTLQRIAARPVLKYSEFTRGVLHYRKDSEKFRRGARRPSVPRYDENAAAPFCDVFVELPSKNLQPNVVTCTILVGAICKEGRIDEAMDLMTQMVNNGCLPDVVTYIILIGALCEEGRIGEAKDMMMQMVNEGCLPNNEMYNVFVQRLLKWNKMDDAILVLKEMIARGGCTICATTISMLSEPLRREGNESVLFDMVMKLLPKKV